MFDLLLQASYQTLIMCTSGVDCGETNRTTSVVSEYTKDGRGEHRVHGVCSRVRMAAACMWIYGRFLGESLVCLTVSGVLHCPAEIFFSSISTVPLKR